MKNATKYLTESQVEKLMDAAKDRARSKVNGHRDAAMIYLTWARGLRVAELVRLRWSQIDLAAGRINVTRVKNGSPSSQPLFGDGLRGTIPSPHGGPNELVSWVWGVPIILQRVPPRSGVDNP
jgi:integrase